MKRSRRLAALVVLASCSLAAAELRGVITVDHKTPLQGAVVRIELPGRVVVTRTGADGTFSAAVTGRKVLISVLQDGNEVYRDYRDPHQPITIDLESASPGIPSAFAPNALTVLPNQRVFVASRDKKIYIFEKGAYRTSIATDVELSDIAATPGNPPTLYACSAGAVGNLFQYSLDGKQLRSAFVGAPLSNCVSVSVEPGSGTIYAINAAGPAVYRLRSGGTLLSWFANLGRPGANGSVGPSIVDEKRQKLYISDLQEGRINALDLNTRSLRPFAHGLGAVSSLALDPARDRLYAGDIDKNRIWQFDLASPSPAARNFATGPNVTSVYALGVGDDGTVWAADRKTRTLTGFSPEGQPRSR